MIKCTRCPSFQNKYKVNCIPFSGNANAEVYLLGGMAEQNEAHASKLTPSHFVGKADGIISHLLAFANLTRGDVAIANSHRCYKSDSTPNKKELASCFIHTYNEIQNIKPKLVVVMGDIALKLALDVEGIASYRGKVLWSEKLQCNVLTTYHPIAVGYDPSRRKDIEDDFKLIPTILSKEIKAIKLYDYVYINDITKVTEEAIEEIAHSPNLSFDVESTGLSPYKDNLRIVQIGIGKEPIFIFDIATLNLLKLEFPYLFQKLKHSLESIPIIGQTFEFDVKFIYLHLGIFPEVWYHDTCLAEYMLTGMKDNDLTTLVSKYVPESYGYDTYVNSMGGAHNVKDMNKLMEYGACDVGVLPKICKRQVKQLIDQGGYWYFTNIMMLCNRTLCKMSLRGIKYDVDELMKVDEKYKLKGDKLLEKALKVKGIDETEKHFKQRFNPKSGNHIKYLLLDYYGLPVLKKTRKKGPSVGSKEMQKYAEAPYKNKYCSIMETYRSLESLRKNFLSGTLSKLHDGVAHTRYSLHSTTTSRPNSTDPNLLNIPSGSGNKDIKGCLVARPGFTFIAADMSQIEIRIASVVYEDDNLLKLCNTPGSDFHSLISSDIYKIPYDEFYAKYKAGDSYITDLRTAAKATSFGILYGMSNIALSYRLGITEEKAQRYITDYFNKFKQLKESIENVKRFVIEHGYVRNYFGFTRRWQNHSADDLDTLREAQNFPIQSIAWNLVQIAMIEIDTYLGNIFESITKEGLVLQVYDSIIAEVHDEYIDNIVIVMKNAMENSNSKFSLLNKVKLLADFQVGKNLRDLKKYSFKPLTND